MAFQDKTKANVGFKKIVGKAHTSNSREHFNESEVSGFTLSSSRIFAEKINPVPSNNAGIISSLVILDLSGVSGANTAYVAKLGATVPVSLQNIINPITNLVYAPYDRVGNIVPESYGSGFRPILKNNGVEVPPLDSSDWFVDVFAGIVTQENDADSPLLNLVNGTLECYVYIGKFIDNVFDDLSSFIITSSGNLQDQINDITDDLSSFIISTSSNLQNLQDQININTFDIELLNTSILEISDNFSNSILNLDSNVVHLTGSESISGSKTFVDDIYADTLALMSGGGWPIYIGYSELVSSIDNGKLVKTGVKTLGITHRVDSSFSYADISGSGSLAIEHNLGNQYCSVTVIDDLNKMILPDEVIFSNSNELSISLNSFGIINGVYKAVIIG